MFFKIKFVKRLFLYLFLVSLFLIFPFKVINASIDEELLEQEQKIYFPEREVNTIVNSLNQEITNEWIKVVSSPVSDIEKEAILILLRAGVRANSFRYLMTQAPKEVVVDFVKTGIKLAPVFFDFGFSTFQKMGIDEAKKYAVEWLLKNELRIGGGNLPLSYKSHAGEIENVNFPFILVYNPKNNKIEISIYSSKEIKTPETNLKYQWTGGVEKLSPFIVNISGELEKNQNGRYVWITGPTIEISFPESVPDFQFQKPSFVERQINSLKNQLFALYLAGEKIDNLITEISEIAKSAGSAAIEGTKGFGNWVISGVKNFFSSIGSFISTANPFGASVHIFYDSESLYDYSSENLLKQKAKEILNLINGLEFLPEEDHVFEEDFFDEDEMDINAILSKLTEMDKIIRELQDKTKDSIEIIEESSFLEEDSLQLPVICSVNINTASKEELQKIIGIGPTYAERIIEARPFSSVSDLIRVSGIGEATLLKILEQNCAYVEGYINTGGGGSVGIRDDDNNPNPISITLEYNIDNFANDEIEINVSVSNLLEKDYDIKISIEKEGDILSNIYDKKEEKWKSSIYYINDIFSISTSTDSFLLKIREDKKNFKGEADLVVRIRENEKKKIIIEKKETINILEEIEVSNDYYFANIQQNPQKTGYMSVVGPAEIDNPVSEPFLIGEGNNDYFYNIAIDIENNLYFRARINNKEGVYSYSQEGEKRWYKEGNINSVSDPIITSNGNLFFYTNGGNRLYLYSTEGEIIWEKSLDGYNLFKSPVSYNNLIYSLTSIRNGFRNLVAINVENGEIAWEYETEFGIATFTDISIGEDGTTYFGVGEFLYAISQEGEKRWVKEFEGNYSHYTFASPIVKNPVIKDNEIYLITFRMGDWKSMQDMGYINCAFKLGKDEGEEIWRICNSNFRFETLSISEENNIYFGAGRHSGIRWHAGIYSITEERSERWVINNLDIQTDILLLDKNENIYSIFGNSLLRAYNKEGELKWQYSISPSHRVKYLSMDGDGNLYIVGPKNIHIIRNREVVNDLVPPNVYFSLQETQNDLSFIVSWEGEDLAQEEVEPSGIEGYQLRYLEDNENWTYLIPESGLEGEYINKIEYEFTGEDEKTYYFKVRARDNAKNISDWIFASTTIAVEKEPTADDNFIENWNFEEWQEPANSSNFLIDWDYSGNSSHITRSKDAFFGDYSSEWKPITSANNLIQTNIEITEEKDYYAEIWIKPINVDSDNYIRVSLDVANSIDGNFPNASFTNYKEEVGWVKLEKTGEIKKGNNGGIRIRAQRVGNDAYFLIGAVWLSYNKPPLNWPFE